MRHVECYQTTYPGYIGNVTFEGTASVDQNKISIGQNPVRPASVGQRRVF
jgi:hypothetical protein